MVQSNGGLLGHGPVEGLGAWSHQQPLPGRSDREPGPADFLSCLPRLSSVLGGSTPLGPSSPPLCTYSCPFEGPGLGLG